MVEHQGGIIAKKKRDNELYLLVKDKYESYITREKLEECLHKFDSNINKSLNNIVSKYAQKRKHFSKSLSLFTRVFISAGIYLVSYHYLWSSIFKQLEVDILYSLELCWLNKDKRKVTKYGKEHTTEYKKKKGA